MLLRPSLLMLKVIEAGRFYKDAADAGRRKATEVEGENMDKHAWARL